MSQFINLTPHTINVWEDINTVGGGRVVSLFSRGVARCATVRQALPDVAGVRLTRQAFGQVEGLPEPQPDTVYIVSALVLSALAGSRPDVVAPDTGGDAIRENGQIKAVRGLVC